MYGITHIKQNICVKCATGVWNHSHQTEHLCDVCYRCRESLASNKLSCDIEVQRGGEGESAGENEGGNVRETERQRETQRSREIERDRERSREIGIEIERDREKSTVI